MFQLTDNCEVCTDTIFGAKRLCACEWSSFKMVPFCSIEIAFIMYGIYYTIHDGCGILSRNASFSLIWNDSKKCIYFILHSFSSSTNTCVISNNISEPYAIVDDPGFWGQNENEKGLILQTSAISVAVDSQHCWWGSPHSRSQLSRPGQTGQHLGA